VKQEKKQAVFDELEATAADMGVGDYKVDGELTVQPVKAKAPEMPSGPIRVEFERGMEEAGLMKDYHAGKPVATRQAYGAALLALGLADRRIVGLDADVKNSTYSQWLYKRLPNQFLECRIAEQNMFSVAVGVAAAGKIPFASTFAKFCIRAYDQIEMGINTGANFKVVGSHAGVTLAADGPSQMSLPDVAFFRSFTRVKNYYGETAVRYFFPSDPVSCFKAAELMANLRGCCYLRTLRAALPALYQPSDTFEVGGWKVLREGKDVVLVSAGYMVHECLRAADELSKAGKHATVIDAYSLPLNVDGILEIAQRNGGRIITVEDNYTGGLDAELGIAIAERGAEVRLTPFETTRIPKSGREPEDVLAYLDLDYRKIAAAV
jgi:transketolase